MKKRKEIMSITLCMLVLIGGLSFSGATHDERDVENSLEKKSTEMFIYSPLMNGDGTVWYVGGSGPNNYSKIQDAIDNASDGDTVFVYDDSSPYLENLFVNTSINLIGENKNSTIINGGDRGHTITVNADSVRINGFTIERNGWYDDGIVIHANNTYVFGNIFNNDGTGIWMYKTSGNVIINNFFTDCHDAIKILTSQENVIENNLMDANYFSGIVLSKAENNIINNNTIIGNTDIAIQPSYVGIKLQNSNDNIISNNTIIALLDNGWSGIRLWYSNDNLFDKNSLIKTGFDMYKSEENTFTNNSVNGKPFVFLLGKSDEIIDDAGQVILVKCKCITVKNLECSNLEYGIDLQRTHNSIIQGNSLFQCWYGIRLELSWNNKILGNTLDECRYGIVTTIGLGNVIADNTIEKSDYTGILVNSIASIIRKNTIVESSAGIVFAGCLGNKAILNTITESKIGIFVTFSIGNIIQRNNFINDELPAGFYTAYLTRWVKNYWGRPRFFPKAIEGDQLIWEHYEPWGGGWKIELPWLNIDFRPARIPIVLP